MNEIFNSALSFQTKPGWILHDKNWSPQVEALSRFRSPSQLLGSSDGKASLALTKSFAFIQAATEYNGGTFITITSNHYNDSYKSILQIGVLPFYSIEKAQALFISSENDAFGYNSADTQARVRPDMLMTSGVLPADDISVDTALRIIQFYIQHGSDTYLFRFTSFFPAPNGDTSYEDTTFFGSRANRGFPEFVLNGVTFT